MINLKKPENAHILHFMYIVLFVAVFIAGSSVYYAMKVPTKPAQSDVAMHIKNVEVIQIPEVTDEARLALTAQEAVQQAEEVVDEDEQVVVSEIDNVCDIINDLGTTSGVELTCSTMGILQQVHVTFKANKAEAKEFVDHLLQLFADNELYFEDGWTLQVYGIGIKHNVVPKADPLVVVVLP